jgi:hypothetical protein
MRDNFDAIPDPGERRDGPGTMLARIYHDIGLAAVADALNVLPAGFDADTNESLERGQYYLFPPDRALAPAGARASHVLRGVAGRVGLDRWFT